MPRLSLILVLVLLNSVALAEEKPIRETMVLISALKHNDPDYRERARQRLEGLGAAVTPAIPTLFKLFVAEEDPEISKAIRLILFGLMEFEPKRIKDAAWVVSGDEKLTVTKRVDALLLLLDRVDLRHPDAVNGPECILIRSDIPRIEKMLTQAKDLGDLLFLARLLTVVKPDSKLIAPALVRVMKSEDQYERLYAVFACHQQKHTDPVIIKTLGQLLEDASEEVRSIAILQFQWLGPAANSELPALEHALELENSLEGKNRAELAEAVLIVKGKKPSKKQTFGGSIQK